MEDKYKEANNKLASRKRLDKVLEKVREEVDIWNSYEDLLVSLQDEYYEGKDVIYKRENNEAIINSIVLWDMINESVSRVAGDMFLEKYSTAVFTLLSKDLDIYASFKNKDVLEDDN